MAYNRRNRAIIAISEDEIHTNKIKNICYDFVISIHQQYEINFISIVFLTFSGIQHTERFH